MKIQKLKTLKEEEAKARDEEEKKRLQ